MTAKANQLPQPLQEWANTNKPSETLIYKDGYWEQIIFVRDKVAGILAKDYEEYKIITQNIKVISTHYSKSVNLPVFQVELPDGTLFIMRYNFYDWKVSVVTQYDLKDVDFLGLFKPNKTINSVYCEGFPNKYVFKSFSENNRLFTIELGPEYHYLFMFFWIFSHKVLKNK